MYYHLYKDATGQWRWRFKAANGKIIADSGESYWNKADAENGIRIIKGSSSSPVIE